VAEESPVGQRVGIPYQSVGLCITESALISPIFLRIAKIRLHTRPS